MLVLAIPPLAFFCLDLGAVLFFDADDLSAGSASSPEKNPGVKTDVTIH
jgi:hypothetical protein